MPVSCFSLFGSCLGNVFCYRDSPRPSERVIHLDNYLDTIILERMSAIAIHRESVIMRSPSHSSRYLSMPAIVECYRFCSRVREVTSWLRHPPSQSYLPTNLSSLTDLVCGYRHTGLIHPAWHDG